MGFLSYTHKIMKLLTVDIDTADLNTQAKQLKENLKHLIEYVLEDYDGFIKHK